MGHESPHGTIFFELFSAIFIFKEATCMFIFIAHTF